MKVLISGSTGLVGRALSYALERDSHTVLALVRRSGVPGSVYWDPESGRFDSQNLPPLDAVVHLAGEPLIGWRWTASKKNRIRRSRIDGTRLLAQTLARLPRPPAVFISASAIGFYGNQGDAPLTESSPKGEGFLADVCAQWENATEVARQRGIRVIHLRTSLVLSKKGGFLRAVLPAFRACLGGPIGSGAHYMSWVSMDDMVGAIRFLLQSPKLQGAVNVSSPTPLRQKEFASILAQTLYRPAFFPVPRWAVKTFLGEMGESLLLSSARVLPQALTTAGFAFRHPTLAQALRAQKL